MIGKIPDDDYIYIPADPPKEKLLGFCVYELDGFEIYDASTLKPIPASEPLIVGRKIVFDDCGGRASVEVQDNGSGPFVETGHNRYLLRPCKDDRACWVYNCVVNVRAFMPRVKETLFK